MGSVLQWVAIVVEFLGLLLVAIELYFPVLSERLKSLFEEPPPGRLRRPKTWIAAYILIWIVAATVLSIWQPSVGIIANVTFTVFTTFLLVLFGISRLFVKLGVALGRGNTVGGVGLVMALIGSSIEISQFISG